MMACIEGVATTGELGANAWLISRMKIHTVVLANPNFVV